MQVINCGDLREEVEDNSDKEPGDKEESGINIENSF